MSSIPPDRPVFPRLLTPAVNGLAHQALIYDSDQELIDATVPFLLSGLARGDRLLVVASAQQSDALRADLGAVAATHVVFEESSAYYARPARALWRYQQRFTASARSGRRLRVVSAKPLASMTAPFAREAQRGDAALNEVGRVPGVAMVCVFDGSAITEEARWAVQRTHPTVTESGVSAANAAYTPARDLLAEHDHGMRLDAPPAGTVTLRPPGTAAEVRRFVRFHGRDLGLHDHVLDDFVLAVHEVAANAQTHAMLDLVRVWEADEFVTCELVDTGSGMRDPLAGYRCPEPGAEAGRGLWLARVLTDLLEVRTGPAGSTFRLHMRRHTPALRGVRLA